MACGALMMFLLFLGAVFYRKTQYGLVPVKKVTTVSGKVILCLFLLAAAASGTCGIKQREKRPNKATPIRYYNP